MRFTALVIFVFVVCFAGVWIATGRLAAATSEAPDGPAPALRERSQPDNPALWRMAARAQYAPPAPLGGRAKTVPGRLMVQACQGLQPNSWQVPAGARMIDLCTCVGRMMDRTPDADGLAALTDAMMASGHPLHPESSSMATGLITARITCQRALFGALHASDLGG